MTIIKERIFNQEDKKTTSSLDYNSSSKNLIKSCIKHSCHRPTSKYFQDLESPFLIHGHHEDKANKMLIIKKNNQLVSYPDYSKISGLDYHHIYRNVDYKNEGYNLTFNKCFFFTYNSSWSWQHFIQDAIHYIVFAKEILDNNPDIFIVLEEPREDFPSLEFIIRNVLGLKNPIYYLDRKKKYFAKVNEFYESIFDPNLLYSCPPIIRYDAHNMILNYNKNHYDGTNKYLTYFTRRNCTTRKINNESTVIQVLRKYATKLGLEFKIINTANEPFENVFKIMYQSKIVFAPHGGSNFNIYWCKKNTLFIECIFVNQTETCMNLARSIGLKYYIIPIPNTNHHSPSFQMNLNELEIILDRQH